MNSIPPKQVRSNSQTVYLSFISKLVLLAMCVALLGACASAPKRENVGFQFSASADVNPDLAGRPSPVILHVLELNSEEQFNRLDYQSLTQPSGAALGIDLLAKNRLELSPGETKPLPIELNPQTTYIGLVAGFRDIDNAVWRASVPIVQGTTKSVSVTLEKQSIITSIK